MAAGLANGICRGRVGAEGDPAPEVQLSEVEKTNCKQYFKLYDYDGSGTIDISELRELLLELRLSVTADFLDEYVQQNLRSFDKDKNQKLTFEEFEKLYMKVLSDQPTGIRKFNTRERITVADMHDAEQKMREEFDKYDADGSGYLDTGEMLQLLQEMGFPDPHGDGFQTLIAEHMEFADLDHDGKVDFQEFVVYSNALYDYLYKMQAAEAEEQVPQRRY